MNRDDRSQLRSLRRIWWYCTLAVQDTESAGEMDARASSESWIRRSVVVVVVTRLPALPATVVWRGLFKCCRDAGGGEVRNYV